MTQRRTECRRCETPFGEHVETAEHIKLCPDGTGRTFQKRESSNIGMSFTDAQIDCGDRLIRRILMTPQLADLVRHKGFSSLARKFHDMQKRAIGRKHSISEDE